MAAFPHIAARWVEGGSGSSHSGSFLPARYPGAGALVQVGVASAEADEHQRHTVPRERRDGLNRRAVDVRAELHGAPHESEVRSRVALQMSRYWGLLTGPSRSDAKKISSPSLLSLASRSTLEEFSSVTSVGAENVPPLRPPAHGGGAVIP